MRENPWAVPNSVSAFSARKSRSALSWLPRGSSSAAHSRSRSARTLCRYRDTRSGSGECVSNSPPHEFFHRAGGVLDIAALAHHVDLGARHFGEFAEHEPAQVCLEPGEALPGGPVTVVLKRVGGGALTAAPPTGLGGDVQVDHPGRLREGAPPGEDGVVGVARELAFGQNLVVVRVDDGGP